MQIFHHSIFVTHHSSLITLPYPFGTITHLSSLNIFHTVCGLQSCHSMQLFFFPIPKLTEPNEKKKKLKTETSEKRRRKKKGRIEDQTQEKKGKKNVKRCDYGSLHVYLITKMSLNYELWKLKTAKMCFQFP